jgi:hypothetical protein
MDTDATLPNEGTPTGGLAPNDNSHTLPTAAFVPHDDHVALNGNLTISTMAGGAIRSDTRLALKVIDPSIFSNGDQPQPSRRPRSTFDPGGPAEPPFPPPTATVDLGAVDLTTAGAGIAAGVGTYVLNGEPSDLNAKQTRFETLEARVAVLEAALAARPPGLAVAPQLPRIGHNQGPHLDENLNVDEASIQSFIALLKVSRATAPIDLAKLAEAAQVADPSINKWQERVDQFVKGVLFGTGKLAGEEITKQLAHAAWVQSVFSALQSVFEAIKNLFF